MPEKRITIEFEGELKDFLPPKRNGAFCHTFSGKPSVKHLIETLGVPHTEVGAVLVNGAPVDFSFHVHDGDVVRVYPISYSTASLPDEIAQAVRNGTPRFVLDTHLGKLATYLRMCGFDTRYRNDFTDETLATISQQEDRILLTRDQELLKRKIITRGYWVRATNPPEQLREVLQRFDLFARVTPFRRCLRCNNELQPVSKAAILHRLLPKTKRYYREFRICPSCNQIYWKGSHYERMMRFLEEVIRV